MFQHYSELIFHYRRMVRFIFIGIVGGVALFSTFFLYISPVYTATAAVSLLPTDTELAFSQNFVRGDSVNPATLMTQTHIENLLSLEIARETVDKLMADMGPPESAAGTGFKASIAAGFHTIKNYTRRIYNILNSGKHVPLDPYTDAVLTLQDSILAEMVEGTYILDISVTWDSPEVAMAAANDLAEVYVARARKQASDASLQLEEDLKAEMARTQGSTTDIERQIDSLRMSRATGFNVLRVIDPAVLPIYPSFPKVVINTLLAIAAALATSIFALVTADTFSGTLKTRADLLRVLAGNALPTIGHTEQMSVADRTEIKRMIRLRNNLEQDSGAVLAMGSDADADRVAQMLGDVLGPISVLAQIDARVESVAPARTAALVLAVADQLGEAPVSATASVASQKSRRLSQAIVRDRSRLTSFGGASESFAFGGQPVPAWLVIAMRAGSVTEAELQGVVRDWAGRGVSKVYGVVLSG